MKNKKIALLLSVLWPGLGHIYLGKYLSGIPISLVWFLLLSRLYMTFHYPEVMSKSSNFFQNLLSPNQYANASLSFVSLVIWGSSLILFASMIQDVLKIIKEKPDISGSFLRIIPSVLLIIGFIYFSLPIAVRPFGVDKNKYSLGNLHMHTNCSDGRDDYQLLSQRAIDLGFDFIAITDHRYPEQPEEAFEKEKAQGLFRENACRTTTEKCRNETRLHCLLSQEVSGGNHTLAIGIKQHIDFNMPLPEIVKEIHRQGGIAIAAHPMQDIAGYTEEQLATSGIDAMECERDVGSKNRLQKEWSKKYNIPCVYNSDAHGRGWLRNVYNICQGKIKTLEDLRSVIKNGECERFSPVDYLIGNIPYEIR